MEKGSEPPEPASAPGDILAGKYRVERVLGVGGMGKVVSAIHVDLHERRAIKFMLAQHLQDAEAVERFLREARASSRLTSEHVVKVHDVGRLTNRAPYMVMEYLEGKDLGAEVQRRGPLPASEAVLYVLQVCEALAEAHASGIIHRDLKPENLFVTQDKARGPWIKVLDFGISKVTGANPDEMRMTQTAAVMGSPYYMSPEQAKASHDVDPRGDIWSLGVVLFQLVTGRVPFDGKNLTAILASVMFEPCPRPSSIVPSIPAKLDRIILRCLEKDREHRYPSITDLALDLAPLAPARQGSRSHRSSIEDSISAGAVSSDPPNARAGRRSPWIMVGLGVTLSVVVLGSAFLLGRSWSQKENAAAAPSFPSPAAPSLSVTPEPGPSIGAIPPPPAAHPIEVVPAPHPSTSAHLPPHKAPSTRPTTTASKPEAPPEPTGDPFGDGRR